MQLGPNARMPAAGMLARATPAELARGFQGSEPNSGHGDHSAFELQRRGYAAGAISASISARTLLMIQRHR
jgi:hypothetical protein